MAAATTTIRRTRVVGHVVGRGQTEPVPAGVTLEYDARDPYAVTLLFPTAPNAPSWTFARALLTDGRLGVEGLGGDVTASPAADDDQIRIELSSPAGHAVIWLDADAVTRFLEATYHLVPAGTEPQHINWARELAALLRGGDHRG